MCFHLSYHSFNQLHLLVPFLSPATLVKYNSNFLFSHHILINCFHNLDQDLSFIGFKLYSMNNETSFRSKALYLWYHFRPYCIRQWIYSLGINLYGLYLVSEVGLKGQLFWCQYRLLQTLKIKSPKN